MKDKSKVKNNRSKSQSPRPAASGMAARTHNSEVKTKVSKKACAASLTPAEKIAERAYQIWQSRGCEHGLDQSDWLAAEKELLAAGS